jgi:hypothetical protein
MREQRKSLFKLLPPRIDGFFVSTVERWLLSYLKVTLSLLTLLPRKILL